MPASNTILLLGGTTEAYSLAEKLNLLKIPVLSSLAGRTKHPRIPVGRYRIGGFGGINGLVDTIHNEHINLIIDATHPFAETMTDHAWRAAEIANINYIRFERPIWQQQAGDRWQIVHSLDEAVDAIPQNSRCFLAIGRQHLSPFLSRKDVHFVARMVDLPDDLIPEKNIEIMLAKPGSLEEECKFLNDNKFDTMVCRNSGGSASYQKLKAAREVQLPVIMINRKPLPNILSFNSESALIDHVVQFLTHRI